MTANPSLAPTIMPSSVPSMSAEVLKMVYLSLKHQANTGKDAPDWRAKIKRLQGQGTFVHIHNMQFLIYYVEKAKSMDIGLIERRFA